VQKEMNTIDSEAERITQLKRTKGEDVAIEAILKLMSIYSLEYEQYTLLKKACGYYKKANKENRALILQSLNLLIKDSIEVKSEIARLFTKIYLIENDFDQALQYNRLAIAAISPNNSSYLFMLHECLIEQSKILSKIKLSTVENAATYLYSNLAGNLFLACWWAMTDIGSPEKVLKNWKIKESPDFPFNDKYSIEAFNILSKGKQIEKFSNRFQQLLFDIVPNDFLQDCKTAGQSSAVKIIDIAVNRFLKEVNA
jgi:hypothetical protein